MKNTMIQTDKLLLKSPVGVVKPEDILEAIHYKETLQYLSAAPKNYSIEFAFNSLKMKRIDAFVITEHLKSIALLQRLGFEQIELLIDNEENDGVLVDRYKYSLINNK